MKRRNFLSRLLSLPFVRWFAAKFKPPALWHAADELSPEQITARHRRVLDQMIKHWNEEATTTPSDWCKQPFRLD